MIKKIWMLAALLWMAVALEAADIMSITPSLPAEKTLKWWMPRFKSVKAKAAKGGYEVVFLGDSITHGWESRGKNVWAKHFADGPYKALNGGFSGDRTENLLWRIDNGMLDGTNPKAFVLLIGTNNTGHRKIEEERPLDTVLGVLAVVDRLRSKFPKAKIIMHPIFPRGQKSGNPLRRRNDVVNRALSLICKYQLMDCVLWCNFNDKLQNKDGSLDKAVFNDFLHPVEPGYEVWAKALVAHLDFALGRSAKRPDMKLPPAGHTNRPCDPSISTRWFKRNASPRMLIKRKEVLDLSGKQVDLVMIGDSITHRWENPSPDGGKGVQDGKLKGLSILNLGFGGDTTQALLWVLEHGGGLDGYKARNVTLLIGTNNIWRSDPASIAEGIKSLVELIRRKQPTAKVFLMPILPRE
ncbi:MAG: hypothetical protein IJC66_11065, partial [Kiritimatiellae bacterium]|nr:hypothetical protein [Kiritimatiellia bacterium]